MLAKIATQNQERVRTYAGDEAVKQYVALADEAGDVPPRSPHTDPFVRWVERERLTLGPVVELVDPALGTLDWLMLPGIMERDPGAGTPPPLFAMFNVLKADFILARDLAWRALEDIDWPSTGRFADTLDYAMYGPRASALVLAHRTALDILDKIAVTANQHFDLGKTPTDIHFGQIWRQKINKKTDHPPLLPTVEKTIRAGVPALYGLTELAEDYGESNGILRSQKNLRNAGTHRFVVLHDFGDPAEARQAPEIERHRTERYSEDVLTALRIARSALQMLALAIRQYEDVVIQSVKGPVGTLPVPDHKLLRRRSALKKKIR